MKTAAVTLNPYDSIPDARALGRLRATFSGTVVALVEYVATKKPFAISEAVFCAVHGANQSDPVESPASEYHKREAA